MRVRVASHIHSNWSYDGKWTLEQLAALFAKLGYQALLLTEHDRGFTPARYEAYRRACQEASRSNILLIPGIEYSDPDNSVHILAWGEMPFLGEGMDTLELLQAAKEHQGICVLAHPSRRDAWKLYQATWAEYLAGVEVWNRKTDAWAPSLDAIRIIDESGLRPFVGFDFHRIKHLFPFSLILDLEKEFDGLTLLSNIRDGRFRAKTFGLNEVRFRQKHLFALLRGGNALRNILARIYHRCRWPRT